MALGRSTATRRSKWASACRGLVLLLTAKWVLNFASTAFVSAPRAQPSGAPPKSQVQHAGAVAGASATPLLAAALGGAAAANAADLSAVAVDEAAAIDPANAIVQAFLLTFVSEIGDKTFFIAAILAAGGSSDAQPGQDQRVLTFFGAILALAVMTLLAVSLGQVFHAVPDVAGGLPIDDYASILVFGFFGVKLLVDATQMEDDGSLLDEKEEAEEAVRDALPAWISGGAAALVLPPLVLRAFVLVFAAEIGDRSFISAAALSAQGGPPGAAAVFVGGITAHGIATLTAVLLGDLISNYVSEKQLTFIGGALFLVFAALSSAKLAGVEGLPFA
uniref:GDT1 family protein n=1 Tax=Pyrodinium bahamense TaxID=73915 RepID=A0A7S0A4W0_9DINO|mmetsp:Transcript_22402/g.62126  ORF Transcript_22402/g.62126 Transcript_22402/m.62126 type:complete len:333 (+) Transcript_22402:79-1077(+)